MTGTDGKGARGPVLSLLASLATLIDWTGRIIAATCLAVMFVLLFMNVVMRYALGAGIPWAYEIHALLLPWLVAGGVVIAAARGRNIAITLLPDLVGPITARWLLIVVSALVAAICIAVLWTSQPILRASQFQSLATLGIKQVWGYVSIVYAFGGMAVLSAIDALRALGGEIRETHTSLS